MNPRFEYRVESFFPIGSKELQIVLNSWAKEGWRLINVVPDRSVMLYFLERPVETKEFE